MNSTNAWSWSSADAPEQSKGQPRITLAGLLIVVAVLGLLIGTVTPALMRASIASNETAAVGTLRTLATSEAGFQSAAIVDQDGDSSGEFGWLQELSGTTGYRRKVIGGVGGLTVSPTWPAFITSTMGTTAKQGDGIAQRSGYCFMVYLPRYRGVAQRETAGPPANFNLADANDQEVRHACYAWPAELRRSGARAFVVSQQGEVFATANSRFQEYRGVTPEFAPPPGAAYDSVAPESAANLEGQFVNDSLNVKTGDRHAWSPAGN